MEAAETVGAVAAAVVPLAGSGAGEAAADRILELVDAGGGLRANGPGGGWQRQLPRQNGHRGGRRAGFGRDEAQPRVVEFAATGGVERNG